MLDVLLEREGYAPTSVGSADAALAELALRPYDFVLSDLRMPGLSGIELVDAIHARDIDTTVILMSAFGSAEVALEAMKHGAYDYVHKPFRTDEIVLVLKKAEERLRLQRENLSLRQALAERKHKHKDTGALSRLVGDSAKMAELGRTIRKVAEHKTTVLVTGESGTGKELVARALHDASPRKDGPFVAVNCGAIPEPLLESELFGHKKGAFTDASRDKHGLFMEASGGTLFLDEIGEMPIGPQVRLLRVLQEQQVRPVGSNEDETVDVRVIAATTRDLAADVKEGRFREDLFYRLNVIHLVIPPLRDRREDLVRLVEHFLARTNAKLGTKIRSVAPDAMKLMSAYPWPGNIRELENTIERSVVLCDGDVLTADGLPERLLQNRDAVREVLSSGELSIKKTVRIIEEELIRRALEATQGNRTNAAKKLEISHRALLYKMKEYGVHGPLGQRKVEKIDDEG